MSFGFYQPIIVHNIQTRGNANNHTTITKIPIDEKTFSQGMKEYLKVNAGNIAGGTISTAGCFITIESVKIPITQLFNSFTTFFSGIGQIIDTGLAGFGTFMIAGLIASYQAFIKYRTHGSKKTFIEDIKQIVKSNLLGAVTTTVLTFITGIFITAFWWFFAAAFAAMIIGMLIKWGYNWYTSPPKEIRELYIAMDAFSVTQYVMDGTLQIYGDNGITQIKNILIKRIEGNYMSKEQHVVALIDVETNYKILQYYIQRIQNAVTENERQIKETIQDLIEQRALAKKSCIIL